MDKTTQPARPATDERAGVRQLISALAAGADYSGSRMTCRREGGPGTPSVVYVWQFEPEGNLLVCDCQNRPTAHMKRGYDSVAAFAQARPDLVEGDWEEIR